MMVRGIVKYAVFLGVIVGIGIITKILEEVLEKASIKALYFSSYDNRLARRNPENTEEPLSSPAIKAHTQVVSIASQIPAPSRSRLQEQKQLQQELSAKLKELEERIARQRSGWDANLPTIFIVTPTYRRFLQKAELTRLAQTFKHVKNLHWIVVEDSHQKTNLVKRLLTRSALKFTHLNVRTPMEMRRSRNKPRWTKSRGVEQRNIGLQWLRKNINANETKGVVYFGDDDNTYDIRIFDEMRSIKTVGVWPVAFTGAARWAGPICRRGHVVGFHTNWKPFRAFPVDMAAFAINIRRLLVDRPQARFDPDVKPGFLETSFLEQVTSLEELEPKADNCMKVFVWHTRTETPIININGEKQLIKRGNPSNPEVET